MCLKHATKSIGMAWARAKQIRENYKFTNTEFLAFTLHKTVHVKSSVQCQG